MVVPAGTPLVHVLCGGGTRWYPFSLCFVHSGTRWYPYSGGTRFVWRWYPVVPGGTRWYPRLYWVVPITPFGIYNNNNGRGGGPQVRRGGSKWRGGDEEYRVAL